MRATVVFYPQRKSYDNGKIIIAGMGIVSQPSFIVGDAIRAKKLVPLLTEYDASLLPIYAVYPSRQHLSAKVRTFVDYLAAQFGEDTDWDRGI